MFTARWCVGFVFACLGSMVSAEGPYALHNGDRVLWYGDSITDNSPYCLDVEAYTVLHYPRLNVRFYNAGVGGDRVTGGWMGPIDQRLTRDLFSRRPTVITCMLGMNDASYSGFDEGKFATFKNGYQHMVDRFHKEAPNARVYLFRPSPYDEVAHTQHPSWMTVDSYNGVLLRYADYVSDLARTNSYGVVDQNAPMNEVLAKAKQLDPTGAQKIIGDNIHPGWQGDYVMAEQVLKTWGAPAVVSDVQIEAGSGKATSQNARVSNVTTGPNLSWTETDQSLPFPLDRKDETAKLVLASSDFEAALNQENLKVTGLPAGQYSLKIDGTDVGKFSADQFGNGINLAQLDTPMLKQAAKVMQLTHDRCDLWYQRWRLLDFQLQNESSNRLEAAKRGLDGEIEDLVGRQHAAAMPVEHKYELRAV